MRSDSDSVSNNNKSTSVQCQDTNIFVSTSQSEDVSACNPELTRDNAATTQA